MIAQSKYGNKFKIVVSVYQHQCLNTRNILIGCKYSYKPSYIFRFMNSSLYVRITLETFDATENKTYYFAILRSMFFKSWRNLDAAGSNIRYFRLVTLQKEVLYIWSKILSKKIPPLICALTGAHLMLGSASIVSD